MRNITILLLLSLSFGATEPQTGWFFEQSTLQSFYMFDEITIDGDVVVGDGTGEGDGGCELLGTCDVVGAFRRGVCSDPGYQNSQQLCEIYSVWNTDEEICIGWRYANSNGFTVVPLMGKDGAEGTYTFTYANYGESAYLKVYDSSNGSTLDLNPSAELPGWDTNVIFNIEGTSTANNTFGCTDASACNYDPDVTVDDGSCEYISEGKCDCDGNVLDECGVCGGDNADQDCAGVCFGPSVDTWCDGVCGETGPIYDICGECGGNDYDLCDGDGDGDYNIDDWGYGAHGFGEDGIDVQDVPEDQGGRVYITFYKSFYDTDTLRNTESYTIERLDSGTWTSLHSIAAYGSETYQTVAETLNNATETDTIYTEFRIIASMEEGNFVSLDNENGFGYSVDNIHPATPELTSAEHEDMDVSLNWQYELEEDFAYHRITSLNYIANTISDEHSFTLNVHDEHWVNSVDYNGNYSDNTESIMSISLHAGANLKSFNVLPDDNSIENVMASIEGIATGVIGQGVAANYSEGNVWMGSLNTIQDNSGYWIIVSEDDVLLLIGSPSPRDIVYAMETGANLISYPFRYKMDVEEALPEGIGCDISGIIGEGVAALCNESGWTGSLSSLEGSYGYWFIAEEATEITFNGCDEPECASLSRQSQNLSTVPDGFDYSQSTTQAFYFIEDIENIKVNDWILSFNGDNVIGARQWMGSIIDLPAMGSDGSDYTKGYMESGSVPQFKLLRDGELINLEGDIPAFENNQLYMVSSLTEAVPLPETFSLDRAYPNPFNPTTTLSFALPVTSNVILEVYDINGRLINELIKGIMDAGYHSVVWDANSYGSGVYFVKMVAGEYINTQKLMLIK